LKIDFRPFIKVEPIYAKEFRQQRISILDYTAVVFTSERLLTTSFRLCEEMRLTVPECHEVFCISEQVALLSPEVHYLP
jgi:uroporphyrinogen-III synthase